MSPVRRARIPVLAAALLAVAGAGAAQTVERVGSSDVALDRRLARLLAADPLIVAADRRIGVGDTIRRSVLVVDATVIHEGTILGDLVVVDGGAFVRHEATVRGDLVNMGGGLYRSARARIGGTIIDLPDASYRVVREEDRILIEGYSIPDRLTLDGFAGFRVPTYDRVNGVTAIWGAGYRLPRIGRTVSVLRGYGGWRTELGEPTFGGSLEVRRGAMAVSVGFDRGWDTHDDWAIGDVRNSLNYLWDGDDYRNYYASDRGWAWISRTFGDQAKRFYAVLRVAGQIEDAASLAADEPWHLLGDSTRANPGIDDDRINSGIGRLDLEWHGLRTDLTVAGEYEVGWQPEADRTGFQRATLMARFAMEALFGHTLEIRAFGQLPLGRDTLPRQRWSFIGGVPTLNTVPIGARRGDHVAYVETLYRIPAPEALALPILGAPELHLLHAAGNAWVGEPAPPLTQEVGARLQFFGPYVEYVVQPGDTSRDEWVVGLAWPFGERFPWER
ncbi:MAG: hypothetical protein R3314_09730 [Longimicrobiales bacterium]|nr:hypothetical protein [Longimicrobiales bacterium]